MKLGFELYSAKIVDTKDVNPRRSSFTVNRKDVKSPRQTNFKKEFELIVELYITNNRLYQLYSQNNTIIVPINLFQPILVK